MPNSTGSSTTFSIITPTLDRSEWLEVAARSVLAQTHEDWEWIVYDVGDTPASVPDDPRIRYHRGERQGPAADFQAALELATGDIIHPLSDDDRIVPHALETVAANIGDKDWLVAGTVIVNTAGYPVAIRGGTTGYLNDTLEGRYMLGGAVYWCKSLTDRLGGFRREFDGAADFDLYLRFAKDGVPALVREILYVHVAHEAQDSHAQHGRQAEAAGRIAAANA